MDKFAAKKSGLKRCGMLRKEIGEVGQLHSSASVMGESEGRTAKVDLAEDTVLTWDMV